MEREAVTFENLETEKLGEEVAFPEDGTSWAWALVANLNSSVRSMYAMFKEGIRLVCFDIAAFGAVAAIPDSTRNTSLFHILKSDFGMGERKVVNKFIPWDFDPDKVAKVKLSNIGQFSVRMMLPFTVRCNSCGEFMYAGKKFNTRKEKRERRRLSWNPYSAVLFQMRELWSRVCNQDRSEKQYLRCGIRQQQGIQIFS